MVANRVAYGETVHQLALKDERIVVVDSDCVNVLNYGKFEKDFPDRFFECGIAEQNMVSVAAGLASCGFIPFVASFAVFTSMRALDQIRNMVCYNHYNVKIIGTHAGVETGFDGATHQAIEDIAIMRAIPGMKVVVPSTPIVTEKLTRLIAETDGPVYMRFGREPNVELYQENVDVKLGGSQRLREGNHITIMACGRMVDFSMKAAEQLKQRGIDSRVVDMYSIKPIDGEEIEKAVKETEIIFTVEDHNIIGGLGGAVCEYTASHCLCRVVSIGVEDHFGRSGNCDDLFRLCKIMPENIVECVLAVLDKK